MRVKHVFLCTTDFSEGSSRLYDLDEVLSAIKEQAQNKEVLIRNDEGEGIFESRKECGNSLGEENDVTKNKSKESIKEEDQEDLFERALAALENAKNKTVYPIEGSLVTASGVAADFPELDVKEEDESNDELCDPDEPNSDNEEASTYGDIEIKEEDDYEFVPDEQEPSEESEDEDFDEDLSEQDENITSEKRPKWDDEVFHDVKLKKPPRSEERDERVADSVTLLEYRCFVCQSAYVYENWEELRDHIIEDHFTTPGSDKCYMTCPHPGCNKAFTYEKSRFKRMLRSTYTAIILYHQKWKHNTPFPDFIKTIHCPEPGCDFTHVSTVLLEVHRKQTHYNKDQESEKCNLCGIPCVSKKAVLRHKKYHCKKLVRRTCVCSQCGRAFVKPEQLKRHIERYHSAETEYDQSPPKPKRKLTASLKLSQMKCVFCCDEMTYDSWASLKCHMLAQHFMENEDRYHLVCPYTPCKKTFSHLKSKFQLRGVLSVILHHNEAQHKVMAPGFVLRVKCTVEGCDYVHFSQFRMNEHMKKAHSGCDRPVVCDQCGARFTVVSALNKHKKFHCKMLDRQRYFCSYCDKTFLDPDYVEFHIKKYHLKTIARPLCHVCSRQLGNQGELGDHMLKKHGLNPHNRHVYSCKDCDYVTLRKFVIDKHIASKHGEATHVCEHCFQAFKNQKSLNYHLELHTDMIYQCPLCPYTNKHRTCFKEHAKRQHPDFSGEPLQVPDIK